VAQEQAVRRSGAKDAAQGGTPHPRTSLERVKKPCFQERETRHVTRLAHMSQTPASDEPKIVDRHPESCVPVPNVHGKVTTVWRKTTWTKAERALLARLLFGERP
jgi:hypothetical protein